MGATMITVIYHSADFDGLFCREIARKFLPDAKLIGWDYGQPPVPVPEGQIYILDLSPDCMFTEGAEADPSVWLGLFERVIWIDHHKSAIEKYDGSGWTHEPGGKDSFGVPYREFWRKGHATRTAPPIQALQGYRIDGVAACRLAWQWFATIEQHKDEDLAENWKKLPAKQDFIDRKITEPLAVRLAGEYDIWDKRDPRAELFQHGLRSRELTDVIWEMLLVPAQEADGKQDIGTFLVDALLEAGEAIQYSQTKQNASIIKAAGFTIQFEGLTFLACNHARYNSFLFMAGLTPEHDGCFGFAYRAGAWHVSLYHAPGKEHHDLSLIASKYGGGGHRGACGFRVKTLPFSL
jgi:hypothetical protein